MATSRTVTVGIISADESEGFSTQEIARNDLRAMQALVGGYIEPVRGPKGVEAFVNEEGLIRGLPLNRRLSGLMERPLVGDGFFVLTKPSNKRLWAELTSDL